jgi:hypothetical protein
LVVHEGPEATVQRCWGLLADTRRVVAVDFETLDDLTDSDLLAALGELPQSVVGTGLAGGRAAGLALAAGEACERLVLVAGDFRSGPSRPGDSVRETLGAVTAACLMVWGTADDASAAAINRDLRAVMNECLPAYVYDAGRDVVGERPLALVDLCRDFIDRGTEFVRSAAPTVINP